MDANTKAKIEEAMQVLKAAYEQVSPVVEEIKPLVDQSETLTSEQIDNKHFEKVNMSDMPVRPVIPSTLDPNAPEQIRQAAEKVVEVHRNIGTMIGELGGLLVGMAT